VHGAYNFTRVLHVENNQNYRKYASSRKKNKSSWQSETGMQILYFTGVSAIETGILCKKIIRRNSIQIIIFFMYRHVCCIIFMQNDEMF